MLKNRTLVSKKAERLIVLTLCLIPVVWWFWERAILVPRALDSTTSLYDALIDQDYERIESERLAVSYYIDALRQYDKEFGPVTSYEVGDSTCNIFVVPITVDVKTVRGGRQYDEGVVMGGPKGGITGGSVRSESK